MKILYLFAYYVVSIFHGLLLELLWRFMQLSCKINHKWQACADRLSPKLYILINIAKKFQEHIIPQVIYSSLDIKVPTFGWNQLAHGEKSNDNSYPRPFGKLHMGNHEDYDSTSLFFNVMHILIYIHHSHQ